MSDIRTVWFRNAGQGTVFEVEKGSALERRLRREQREVYEDGSDEPTHEAAYDPLTAAEVKKLQGDPASVPGYPAAQEATRAKEAAAETRQKARDELLDATLTAGKPRS